MGWENRPSGRYYYEKKREDGRVVSKYVGRGLVAQLAESVNLMQRAEREELRAEMRRQAAQDRETDALIRRAARRVKLLTDASLLAAGYYRHKGQWRKRRGGHIRQTQEKDAAQT